MISGLSDYTLLTTGPDHGLDTNGTGTLVSLLPPGTHYVSYRNEDDFPFGFFYAPSPQEALVWICQHAAECDIIKTVHMINSRERLKAKSQRVPWATKLDGYTRGSEPGPVRDQSRLA